ncbi:TonB-dependent receptor [Filimonas lacunae]|nr:TonB-dependent receptor [Filimonas lacunae]
MVIAVLLCSTLQLLAQQKKVTGKITDAAGHPVENASVTIKGAQAGTLTKADGSFSINVPATATALVISAIGFEVQETILSDNMTIKLAASTSSLSEVVVTGYGTQKKAQLTGSVAKIGGERIENTPMPSVDQMLQGKVAGLQSTSSNGQPGANQQVRIRGIGSYTATSQPLYVVDGVQINSGDLSTNQSTSNVLSNINANDIESVSVLKDAAATSIYGSRGANGVIIITTKKGKTGKSQLRFDTEVGASKYANLPDAGKPLRAADWFALLKEGMVNKGTYTDAQITSTLKQYGYGNGVDIDWLGLTTQTGKQQQYNLSLSAGDAKTQIFMSGGYFQQEGANIGSGIRRISGNLKVNHNISDKVSVSTNWNVGNVYQNTPASGSGYYGNPWYVALTLRPTQNPYTADGSLNIAANDTGFATHYNPLYVLAHDKNWMRSTQIIGGGNLEYKVIKGLKFTSHMGIQSNNLEEFSYNNPYHGDGKSYGGYSSDVYNRYFLWDWYNQADYHLDIIKASKLTADFKVGYEAISSSRYKQTSTAKSYPFNMDLPYSVNAATAVSAGAYGSDYTFASMYGNAVFSYDSRYSLYLSMRRDGSSRFSDANKYGTFPAAGFTWNVSEEEFMKSVKPISLLKFRATYGKSGNAGIDNYASMKTFNYGYAYNGVAGGVFYNAGNPNLTWEKNSQLDFGIDAGFFKNRINITADYYNKVADDMLFDNPLSETVGFSKYSNNIGKMRNRGWEFAINATPIQKKDFQWDISFNIAHNKNTILELPNHAEMANANDGTKRFKEGMDINSYYLKAFAGVDPATGSALWYTDATRATTTTSYSSAGYQFVGKSASPKYFGGLNNTFTYKGFSLNFDFYYNYGNYVYDSYGTYFMGAAYPTRGKYAANLNRWQKAGDITNVPKYVYGETNTTSGERALYKGDYIRLKNVQLGYRMNSSTNKMLERMHLTSVNLYVRGSNFWTKIYDKSIPFDPEQGVNGTNLQGLLLSKTMTIGLNVGF